MGESWPLIGRDSDLRTIERALEQDDTTGVVVAGESGVGKSRLSAEIAARAVHRGARVEHVAATPATSVIPFGVFAHLVATTFAPDLHELIAEAARRFEDPAVSTLLCVDDAQWLDGPSAALLHHMARRSAVKLLVTVRTGEETPDEVTCLWKDGLLRRFDLGALDRHHTEALVSAVLGDDVRADTVERLWQLSRGNPLFLRELVLAGIESAGREEPPQIVLAAGASSDRLREIVGMRFRRLGDPERAALEAIATGEPVPLSVATRLTSPTVLEELERRSLVELTTGLDGDELRTAHPLYGEVIRLEVPPLRRRRILAQLATAAGDLGLRNELRVAVWRLQAGDTSETALLVDAGREALARFDPALAEQFALAAARGGDARAGVLLGQALVAQGRPEAAERGLAGLHTDEPEHVAAVAAARAWALFFGLGRATEAIDVLTRAEAELVDAPGPQALCRAIRADTLMFAFHVDEAVELASEIVDDERATVDARLQALACASIGWALRSDWQRIRDISPAWLELAGRHNRDVPYVEERLRTSQWMALAFEGRLLEAQQRAEEQVRLARGAEVLSGTLLAAYGRVLLERGLAHEALEALSRATRVLRASDMFAIRPLALSWKARSAVFAGALGEAREAVDEAERLCSSSQVGAFAVPDTMLARAWLLAAEGATTEALALARTVADVASSQVPYLAADALCLAMRLGHTAEAAERLAELGTRFDSHLVRAITADARARADADASGVEAASAVYRGLGADLLAAEAAACAANLHRRAGRQASALACDENAVSLLARCGNPVSPTLVSRADETVRLTVREREIALLISHGSTSRAVAERLHLSVRTIEAHLGRVYDKLGINSRQQLVAAFGANPPT